MTEPVASPRVSCLSLILCAILAVGAFLAARGKVLATEPLEWKMTVAVVVAAVAVFVVQRRLQGFLWGMVAAALLTFHPALRQPVGDWTGLLAEAALLAALAGTAVGWQLTFGSRLAWRVWPVLLLTQAVAIGLAWAGEVRAGVLAIVVTAGGLVLAAALARKLPVPAKEQRPGRLNGLAALLMAAGAPALGLFLYQFLSTSINAEDGSWAWQMIHHSAVQAPRSSLSLGLLNRWFWPTGWVALPVLLLGLWRTVNAGRRCWSKGEPPTAWLLSGFAALVVPALLWWPPADAQTVPLSLSALVTMLTVFLVADLLHTGARRLVLPPPDEREKNEVELTRPVS